MLLPFAAHKKLHLVTCDQPYFLDMAYLARFCLKIGLIPILNMIDSNADTSCQLWNPFTYKLKLTTSAAVRYIQYETTT